MITYRSMIYMVLDELKINSDDSVWENDHIVFLLNKYRAFLCQQRYSGIKKDIPLAYYQGIHLEINEPQIKDSLQVSSSKLPVPAMINFNGFELENSVAPVNSDKVDYFKHDYNLVPIDRFKFIGYNKWLKPEVYCAVSYDNHLYIKAKEGLTLPTSVMYITILDNPMNITDYMLEADIPDDLIDLEFPIPEAMVQPIMELVLKELGTANYLPGDKENNANDDLEGISVNNKRKM